MEATSWMCSSCERTSAGMFCLCQAAGVPLCTTCFPIHFTKNPELPHPAYPIQAYPFRTIPGYFDRLRQRSESLALVCGELRENLTELDRCIEELAQKAEVVLAAIKQYVSEQTQKLQCLRTTMEAEVEQSIAEVQRSLYEDQPLLTSKYGPALRTGGSLKFVSYQVQVNSALPALLLSVTDSSEAQWEILPQVFGSTLRRYNMKTGHTSAASLAHNFDSTSFCLLDEDTLLCAGGDNPVTATTWLLQVSQATLSALPPLRTARYAAVLIKHGPSAYLFGGLDGSKWLQECEKFAGHTWTPLPSMQRPRAAFSACSQGDQIFLVCTSLKNAGGVIETFSVSTEVFTAHPVPLPAWGDCSSVSFIAEGELIILASNGQMGKLRIDTETAFRISSLELSRNNPRSIIPPMKYNREIFWASYFNNGDLMKFHLDTHVFSR